MTIVALHGFLGQPSDWDGVVSAVPGADWIVPDYTREKQLSPRERPLPEWGKAFGHWLRDRGLNGDLLLVGYSQGGRLALHALDQAPELFRSAVIVSAQPGWPEDALADRAARRSQDEAWAARFEREPWEDVLRAWNAQAVFAGGRGEPPREERVDSKELAAASLRRWSPASQRDFRFLLREKASRLSWVVGQNDRKYLDMAKRLSAEFPTLDVRCLDGAGHRVLFDAPEALAGIIRGRISELERPPGSRP